MSAPLPVTALPDIARAAIQARLSGQAYAPPPLEQDHPRGAFVTLTREGALRGCIGHIGATRARLSEEVAEVAVLAALRDPRFPPLRRDELADTAVEVSVLADPEPVTDRAVLDPKRYGVIVTAGDKRGVLLPDLDGVDTIDEQLRIVLRKAGIHEADPWRLQRFEVRKYRGP